MNKNIKKSLKGGSYSINSMSQSLKTNDPISDATNMGFQKANEIIPFSDAQKEVSNNINKANTFVSDATSQINSLASDANNSVSQAQNAANAQLQLGQPSKGILNEIIEETGNAVSDVADTVANVEGKFLGVEAKALTTSGVAVATALGDTIEDKGPEFADVAKKATTFLGGIYKNLEIAKEQIKAETEIAKLQIDKQSKASQIEILKDPKLPEAQAEAQAEAEFKKIEEKREEDEKADRDAELKMEEAAAAAATALELAKAAATAPASGGSRKKMMTLSQIQKGGRQSANRTKKSINDFFNSSVTSSQILKRFAKPDNKRKTIRKSKRRKHGGRRSRKQKI